MSDDDALSLRIRVRGRAGPAGAFALALALLVASPPGGASAQESPASVDGAEEAGARGERRPVPAAPTAILHARPFVSRKPIEFVIDGETVSRTEGLILVIEADKTLLQPCDAPDFVIFVGGAVARKVSSGCRSGRVVLMTPMADLGSTPVFFGSRLLPDRITREVVRSELAKASEAGIGARPAAELREAVRKGGEAPYRVADMNELWYETGPLILEHSPDERDMVESLRKS